VFLKVRAWILEKKLRQIFIICLILALVCFGLAAFIEAMTYAAIILGIFCISLSAVETRQNHNDFQSEIQYMRQQHLIKMVENYGDYIPQNTAECFTDEDLKQIKRKNTVFRATFWTKIFFILFLIVLLLSDTI
jgi:hypothetical protein